MNQLKSSHKLQTVPKSFTKFGNIKLSFLSLFQHLWASYIQLGPELDLHKQDKKCYSCVISSLTCIRNNQKACCHEISRLISRLKRNERALKFLVDYMNQIFEPFWGMPLSKALILQSHIQGRTPKLLQSSVELMCTSERSTGAKIRT